MKPKICLVLLLGLLGGLMAGNNSQSFFPYKYQKVKLNNGFSAILIPVKGSGLVAYYTVVRTGSRDEWEPGHTGFAHFFEHMMFRGTKKYPASVYDEKMTEMGADANAYTTDDYTCFYMVVSSRNLPQVMELESDRFQNLSYDESAFKTEAGAVYGEYRKGRVSPWSVLFEKLQDTAFLKHTYKHTTIGFEKDIKNMPKMYDYSRTFFQRYYRPENVVLLIVGDFDPEAVKPLIKEKYGNWKPGYVAPKIQPEPVQRRERFKEVRYSGRTLPILTLAYKGDAFKPADKIYAAGFLLADLAFGDNSEIYKKLVIRDQKVRFISADYSFNRDPGLNLIYTMIKNEKDIPLVKTEIEKTIAKFKSTLVNETELNNLKKRDRYSFLMNLDTPGHIASNLARIIALTGGIEAVNTLYQTVQQVTPQDVQAAARKYFRKNHRTVVILKGVQK